MNDHNFLRQFRREVREEDEFLESVNAPNPPGLAVEALKKAVKEQLLKRTITESQAQLLILKILSETPMTAAEVIEHLVELRVVVQGYSQFAILQKLENLATLNLLAKRQGREGNLRVGVYSATELGRAFVGEHSTSNDWNTLFSFGLLPASP